MMMWMDLDNRVIAAVLARVFRRLGLRRPPPAVTPPASAPSPRAAAESSQVNREADDVSRL